MLERIPFDSLGHADFGWLDARHYFSFGRYTDRSRMGLGALRVWNDDRIAPGKGFDLHPHRDMEIVTYVREGAISHEDSLGNAGRTEAGDIQVMSAGDGIVHGEFNRETVATKLFQIWFIPRTNGGKPWWKTRAFPERQPGAGFTALASGFEADQAAGAIAINSDSALHAGRFNAGDTAEVELSAEESAYLVVAKGGVAVNGLALGERDGLKVTGPERLAIEADAASEVLLAIMR